MCVCPDCQPAALLSALIVLMEAVAKLQSHVFLENMFVKIWWGEVMYSTFSKALLVNQKCSKVCYLLSMFEPPCQWFVILNTIVLNFKKANILTKSTASRIFACMPWIEGKCYPLNRLRYMRPDRIFAQKMLKWQDAFFWFLEKSYFQLKQKFIYDRKPTSSIMNT